MKTKQKESRCAWDIRRMFKVNPYRRHSMRRFGPAVLAVWSRLALMWRQSMDELHDCVQQTHLGLACVITPVHSLSRVSLQWATVYTSRCQFVHVWDCSCPLLSILGLTSSLLFCGRPQIAFKTSCAGSRHNMPPPPTSLPMTFCSWKWCLSHVVTWPTSVPILVFLGLSVLELGPMYATDRQASDTHHRLMPPPYGAGA